MRVGEINEMLHKTEELKALFVFGQRVIPFLEEIFLFIREVTPLLENINTSIEENLSKMPKASQQLSNVTRATELATTEILDTLDGLSYKADVISSNLKQLVAMQQQNQNEQAKIIDVVAKLHIEVQTQTEDKESIYARVADVMRKIEGREGGTSVNHYLESIKSTVGVLQQPQISNEMIAGSEKLLESIRMDSTQIMMSLQVQDITSQQLAAVNSLLQTVQSRLSEIMVHFRNTEIGELIATAARRPAPRVALDDANHNTQVSSLHREIAYDHDIDSALTSSSHRQDHVDSIMTGFSNGTLNESADQDDIDALFANTNTSPSTTSQEQQQTPASTAENVPNEGATPSQSDIDALFAQNN